MDLTARRNAERKLAEIRRDARKDFVRYKEQAADADREYRRMKASVYAEQRSQGNTSVGAEIEANAQAADARHRRDIAESLAKAALLQFAACERDSVSIRDIHSTSERIDGLAA
jgi:hypothetical protein